MNGTKAKARIRIEQDVDKVLKKMKMKIEGQPHNKVQITRDSRYKHYEANEDHIILKDELLFRKWFGETGNVKFLQILTPQLYWSTP